MLRTLLRLVSVILIAGVALALTVAALGVPVQTLDHATSGAPAPLSLGDLERRSYMYAADGGLLAALRAEVNRQPVALADVPPHVVSAILAVEDAGFWTHDGVDARALLRAAAVNVGAGDISQGGSTITQQLLKLSVVGNDKTLDRKLEEIVLARRLERELSKEEILGRYLNTVYFGHSAYGIQAAAETYFGVAASELDVGQAALLAGIIRNPTAYDPVHSPERAQRRRHAAVSRMQEEGIVTAEEAAAIDASPLPIEVQQVLPPPDDYFVEEVKLQLLHDERFGLGATAEERAQAVFTGGLRIFTTFDPRAQELALAARDEHLGWPGLFDIGPAINPGTGAPFVDPATGHPMIDPATGEPQTLQGTASVVSVEPTTGAVRAMVAGPGFEHYKFNLATQNPRQGGSSFKTFVLATLMEQGYSPYDLVDGRGPCVLNNPLGWPDPYIAENFGGSGGGVDTILAQTTRSSNCAYLRLGQIAGLEYVTDVAARLGVTTEGFDPSVMSMPLGTLGVTPLEMVGAYAALANDGVYNRPYYIERVEDHGGRVLYQHTPDQWPAISPQAARLVTSVLQQNVLGGTGTAAQLPAGRPAAGKTGTAQDSADAWFVGYTPHMATAVWMGGIGGRLGIRLGGRGLTGGSYPAQIWGDYMGPLHEGLPMLPFYPPDPTGPGQYIAAPPGIDPGGQIPPERPTEYGEAFGLETPPGIPPEEQVLPLDPGLSGAPTQPAPPPPASPSPPPGGAGTGESPAPSVSEPSTTAPPPPPTRPPPPSQPSPTWPPPPAEAALPPRPNPPAMWAPPRPAFPPPPPRVVLPPPPPRPTPPPMPTWPFP
jgi:membrane peptidoglycan carboxypeptidase